MGGKAGAMADGARSLETIRMDPLNPRARIACMRCGHVAAGAAVYAGCAVCEEGAPLETVYPALFASRLSLVEAIFWARRELQPFPDSEVVNLGQGATPLTPAPRLADGLRLKNETFSPTGAHKDRYHAVAAGAARLYGHAGIVTTSTGNHGVSAAAFAAACGLPAVVITHPDAPQGLLRTIHAFGGVAAQLSSEESRSAVVHLVSRGWFPATSMDPRISGAANPFGAEGYKQVAYELIEQLGAVPEAVLVPTAGGDTLYGIAKGLLEITALTGDRMPLVIAVQPKNANPLSRSIASGYQVAVAEPKSIALSLSDSMTGRQAMIALERAQGRALDVGEDEIGQAVRDLAHVGLYVEPASAAGLAGYRCAVRAGVLKSSDCAVAILTSTGFKWPEAMAKLIDVDPVRSFAELEVRLAHWEPARPRQSIS